MPGEKLTFKPAHGKQNPFVGRQRGQLHHYHRKSPITVNYDEARRTTLPNQYTPADILQIYQYPPAQGTKPRIIGIISLGGSFLPGDLSYYWSTILKIPVGQQPQVATIAIDHANYRFGQDNDADMENTLDLEIAGGICPQASLRFYSALNTFQSFLNAINKAISDQCSVISISWGAPEAYYSTQFLTKFNNAFQSACAQGINICVASGDSGSNDGIAGGVHVDFPSSSPYVIACGGTSLICPTRIYTDPTTSETAWSYNPSQGWGGGGGLSAVFLTPPYQSLIVPVGTTNVPGTRCIPDVAMPADPLLPWIIHYNGSNIGIGGTSCAAPCVAGLLGLLQPPTFFNEILYASRFLGTLITHPIVKGSNDDTSSPNTYNAGPGYNCCTGLGSINGANLTSFLKLSVK